MGTYLIIRQSDGLVVNAVLAEAAADVIPPEGHTVAEPADGAWIGWTLNGSTWTPPEAQQ